MYDIIGGLKFWKKTAKTQSYRYYARSQDQGKIKGKGEGARDLNNRRKPLTSHQCEENPE